MTTTSNRLSTEKSPYLLQHRDNPVAWFPWGDAAFDAARSENKPIFLSIGYSTCYWCHMMEHDSFEREDVAAVLNEHFISIKVDREELPDVDKVYMDAVIAMTGRGGWPLSVFLTPNRKPFYGGTFFWRHQFVGLLQRIAALWQSKRNDVERSAEQLTETLRGMVVPPAAGPLTEAPLRKAAEELATHFDERWGGFGPAPKFPRSESISFLLREYQHSGEQHLLNMAELTLQRMAAGGIYDHIGGGFSRYSTDERWLVPHFEKMLYDNALLATTYLEAAQVTGSDSYAAIARETLEFLLRDMRDSRRGFYSAFDAGEVHREGEYYVWTEKE
ncbi:MAG: thioredoxin domain-containing protein, partial [Bdellovibrionales bacterium]|nr:thioredoxin domain-containing protein [Bdellovibrionales bacterium]